MALIAASCGDAEPPGWRAALLARREALDAVFAGPDSPLAPADRGGFTGLSYYPPEPSWRFEVPPDRGDAGAPVEMLDTRGEVRRYVIDARLVLRRGDVRFPLVVYRAAEGGELFLPFRDATTGRETYAGGRYLEVQRGGNGLYVIDFNAAYNPYCAYDARWSCPVVPAENTVPLAVTAGERAFHP